MAETDIRLQAVYKRVIDLERGLLNLMRARYMDGGDPYAVHLACILLDHPDKYPENRKPKYKPEGCICGERKDPA
jgi:hypothetical protein